MRATHKPVFPAAFGAALLLLAGAALSGCQTTSTDAPATQATSTNAPATQAAKPAEQPELPMTHERAATECWMSTEKGRTDISLDKRADIVTKCIEQKMNGKSAAKPAPKS
jgi:hypothetical protein